MSRYNDTKKVKNFIGGKVYYETTYYNDVPLKNETVVEPAVNSQETTIEVVSIGCSPLN